MQQNVIYKDIMNLQRRKKTLWGDEGAHGMGNLQLLKAPSVSNGLVFLREGVDGAPVAAEEFQGHFSPCA